MPAFCQVVGDNQHLVFFEVHEFGLDDFAVDGFRSPVFVAFAIGGPGLTNDEQASTDGERQQLENKINVCSGKVVFQNACYLFRFPVFRITKKTEVLANEHGVTFLCDLLAHPVKFSLNVVSDQQAPLAMKH